MRQTLAEVLIPRSTEVLDAAWLQSALQRVCPGVVVDAMTVENTLWGTSTKVLVNA